MLEPGTAPHAVRVDVLDVYAFCDPAHSKREEVLKRRTARCAIVVAGQDVLSRIFVLQSWARRCGVDELTEELFATAAAFPRLRGFGIESNAMQSLFAGSVRREARFREVRIPFLPVEQPHNVVKEFRIREALQPVVAAGRLFLRPEDVELRREIGQFPSGRFVDLIDCLASLVRLMPKRRLSNAVVEERDALAAYLRRSGASAAQIELRLAELQERQFEPSGRERPRVPAAHDSSRVLRSAS